MAQKDGCSQCKVHDECMERFADNQFPPCATEAIKALKSAHNTIKVESVTTSVCKRSDCDLLRSFCSPDLPCFEAAKTTDAPGILPDSRGILPDSGLIAIQP